MLFLSLRKKYYFFFFIYLLTIPLSAQVVLNEIYIRPDGSTGSPPNGLAFANSKEYIELYNKSCAPIDISGYFIAMKTNFGPQGGVIRIPSGISIAPGDHFVIGSAAPAGPLIGNTDLGLGTATANNYCIIGSGFRIVNLDGWVALYTPAGTPVDLVYWSAAAGNITSGGFDSDFNPTMPLCNPTSGSPTTPLLNARQIFNTYNATNPSLINHIPIQNPVIAYRTTDGANTWVFTANYTNDAALGATINKAIANGNCNGGPGSCVTPTLPAPPTVTTPVNYCQNATATALTATALPGAILNWYGTNPTGGTASSTAPTPSTTSLGTTTYYVSQTVGGCESLRSAIVVTVNTSLIPALSCGTSTLNSVVFNWAMVAGATGYNLSYQINGNPIVNVGPISNVNTYPFNSLPVNSSVTITLTPTGPAGLCFSSASLTCTTLTLSDCGTCAFPSCPIVGVANYAVRNFGATTCNTWLPSLTNTTINSYYLVQSDANGFVGLVQQTGGSPALCITRTAVLRPITSSCNIASNINPSVLNANGVASGFNPEWYGLTPNTSYLIQVTIGLSAGCTLDSLCSNFYGCSIPASPTASVSTQPTCTTPTGTIVVSAPTGANLEYSINGTAYQTSATFSGLAPAN
ncbi:MAG: lamin tail domain-containing protein, partial [Flavobacterium sp.]|nr:lamin tail domain-containing protein [Flavobacterium sp.]